MKAVTILSGVVAMLAIAVAAAPLEGGKYHIIPSIAELFF